jgi:hypothetical protein
LLTKCSKFTVSDTIVVKVGTEEKEYTLHKKLLAFHSGFFRRALSGSFKETDDSYIPLEDVEVKAFDVFVDWIYRKKLSEEAYLTNGPSIRLRAYVLADMLLALRFKKAIFNIMFDIYGARSLFPPYGALAFAFKSLPNKDPVLQLLVDGFVINHGVDRYPRDRLLEYESEIAKLPQELMGRMLLKMHATSHLSKQEMKLKREDYDI